LVVGFKKKIGQTR